MKSSLLTRSLILIIPLALLVLWLGGVFYSKVDPGNREGGGPAVTGVKVVAVGSSEAPQGLAATGSVQAAESAQLAAKIMAPITAIHVKEGDHVSQGAVLATLDARDMAAQQGQAAAQTNQAKAALDQAALTLERTKALFSSGAASRAELDAAQTAYDAAKAAYEAAQASYRYAGVNVSYGTITAPFSGQVVKKLVDAGNMATPGMPILVLERTPYRLEVNLDESLAQKVAKGMKVPVSIDALNKEFEGTVDEVVPTVDVATRTFTVKIALPADPALRSGMFGSARFNVAKADKILIPASAVTRWSQFTGVFALDDRSVARLRFVRLGETFGDKVEVLSGLNPGDRIVAEGLENVKDGCRVEVAQ